MKNNPTRVTIKNTPAPTPSILEKEYYPDIKTICEITKNLVI